MTDAVDDPTARKIAELGRTIRILQEALHRKNLELDAMHYVWCDGGCTGGVHRFEPMREVPLTEEIVAAAERNTARLRRWLSNRPSQEAAREYYDRLRQQAGEKATAGQLKRRS